MSQSAMPALSAETDAKLRLSAYLTIGGLAAYLGVSERTAHTIRRQDWFPAPIALAPRVIRWSRIEVDEAMRTRAPRADAATTVEPEALQRGREARRSGVIVRSGRIVKEVVA